MYPIVLDIAEQFSLTSQNALIKLASSTIAPTYEELAQHGLLNRSGPKWDDITDDDSWAALYRLWGLARSISTLGENFGLVVHNPEVYDYTTKKFVHFLISQSKETGFHVAVTGARGIFTHAKYTSFNKNFNVPWMRKPACTYKADEKAIQFVAACPHGISKDVLESLVDKYDESSLNEVIIPSGDKLFSLPPTPRKAIYKRIPKPVVREIHRKIYNAWNPSRWGYLRRAGHALIAGDPELILKQHSAYLYGMEIIGREFLYLHYIALSKNIQKIDYDYGLHSLVGAARLAHKVKQGGSFGASIAYYQRAIKYCKNLYYKSKLIYEIANRYAYRKDPFALRKSRLWYKRGFSILSRIDNKDDRINAEITLTNGLALVEYLSGNNFKALRLELSARSLASNNGNVRNWAVPLLNTNMAKIFEVRLNNEEMAIKCLQENLKSDLPYVQENSRINLARFYLKLSEYDKVIDILKGLYEDNYLPVLNKEKEYLGRLILLFSLLAVGENKRAISQIENLEYLSNILNSQNALKHVNMLRKVSEGSLRTEDLVNILPIKQ